MTKGAKAEDDAGRVVDFDHITFWVGNAKTAANYFVTRLGFQPFAVKESKDEISLAVRLNKITIVFQSPTAPSSPLAPSLSAHGDFVKDVALQVSDLEALAARAARGGAEVLRAASAEGDEGGDVRFCVLKTYGANTHTLIDRGSYKGLFLPGYKPLEGDVLNTLLPDTKLEFIDHVEGNLADGTLEESVSWYEKNLNMKRFWCVDYKHDLVPYACINSNSVINKDETVLLSMNEAAKGLRPSSKVTDFVNALGAASVEHIALYTDDIVATMRSLKARGAEIVSFPPPYYDIIREKLEGSSLKVSESIDVLQELDILIDFDERGYMLQAFTKHLQVRPTVFVEVIQRRNHRGFGAMNYKWVFEAIERLDKKTNKEKDENDQKEESSTN